MICTTKCKSHGAGAPSSLPNHPSRIGNANNEELHPARQQHQRDIAADGVLGSATLGAVQALLARRGDEGRRVLLGMITAPQSVQYLEIAERNPSQEAFEFGWQLNRAIGAGLPS